MTITYEFRKNGRFGASLATWRTTFARRCVGIDNESQPIDWMLREFTDKAGTSWSVWDVYPSSRASTKGSARAPLAENIASFSNRELSDGWLCFESPIEKRRLAPIPPEWEICESCVLEDFCTRAGHVTRTPTEALDVTRMGDS